MQEDKHIDEEQIDNCEYNIVTICSMVVDGKTYVGASLWNGTDKINDKVGKYVARGRADSACLLDKRMIPFREEKTAGGKVIEIVRYLDDIDINIPHGNGKYVTVRGIGIHTQREESEAVPETKQKDRKHGKLTMGRTHNDAGDEMVGVYYYENEDSLGEFLLWCKPEEACALLKLYNEGDNDATVEGDHQTNGEGSSSKTERRHNKGTG